MHPNKLLPLLAMLAFACHHPGQDTGAADTGTTHDTSSHDTSSHDTSSHDTSSHDTGTTDTGTTDTGTTDTGTTDTGATDTGTTDTGTTDTGDTGLVENCATPGDEDHNGLADCEDPACFDSPYCVETNCNDGIDNDNDGYTDCADSDCWGHGCAATQAWVDHADAISASTWSGTTVATCPTSTGSTTYPFSGSGSYVQVHNVQGTVLTVSASGGSSWNSCHWSVATATFSRVQGLYSASSVSRTPPTLTGDCILSSSSTAFLPQRLRVLWPNVLALSSSSSATATRSPVWYAASSGTTTPHSSASGYTSSYASCHVQWNDRTSYFQASSISSGSSYFRARH